MVTEVMTPQKVDQVLFFKGTAKNLHTGKYISYPPPTQQAAEVCFNYDLIAQGEYSFYVNSSNQIENLRPSMLEIIDHEMDCFVVEARTGRVVSKAQRY